MVRDYMRKPGTKEKSVKDECIFCKILKTKKELVFENTHAFVTINDNPYKEGHIMIFPREHVIDLRDLDEKSLKGFYDTINFMLKVLEKNYNTKSFNIGCNIDSPAGATYEHLHFHIIPRWVGDSGFMETFASTRVLKEPPEKTRERLIQTMKELT